MQKPHLADQKAGKSPTPRRVPALRARDFVDVWVVSEKLGLDVEDEKFREVLKLTFAAKEVPLRLLGKIQGTREQHVHDFRAVQDTVYPDFDLKDFDFYFNYVVEKCQQLKPLWEEESPS